MTLARFFTLALSTLLLLVFTFTSCQKDKVNEIPEPQQVTEETKYYTPNLGDFLTDRSGYWTEIPAGSVDVLNQAIADADAGGVIYLKAGVHTETDRVTVNKPLKIIGEDGAVLMITTTDTIASSYDPAIYVLNAPGTAIQNVEIRPLDGGVYSAILFENSPQSAVLSSKIIGFSTAILVEKSDKVALIGNTMEGTNSDNGILVNNGKSTYIGNNDVSRFGIGLWACDQWGTIENNRFHDNSSGTLLCKYNAVFGATIPSSDTPIGAEITCTGWKLRNNKFMDNDEIGLSIRDGSTLNMVESNNEYSGNGLYDISIPPDEVFPFVPPLFVPAAYKNNVNAAPGVLIKDCGINNTIIGGTLVDASHDPC